MDVRLNVYRATFEYVRREPGTQEEYLMDRDPVEEMILAPDFPAACLLAQQISGQLTEKSHLVHLHRIRVRDVVLVHADARLWRHEQKES